MLALDTHVCLFVRVHACVHPLWHTLVILEDFEDQRGSSPSGLSVRRGFHRNKVAEQTSLTRDLGWWHHPGLGVNAAEAHYPPSSAGGKYQLCYRAEARKPKLAASVSLTAIDSLKSSRRRRVCRGDKSNTRKLDTPTIQRQQSQVLTANDDHDGTVW